MSAANHAEKPPEGLAHPWPDAEFRIQAALDWLVRSQEVTGCGGSAAYFAPFWGWAAPYPETSGYIVPTLWRGADSFGCGRYAKSAEDMARWLLSLQSDKGWFPAGTLRPLAQCSPSVFNTGQIIFGLVAAAQRTGERAFLQAAHRATRWLVSEQDADGRWPRHGYGSDCSPSYYAHVCWPLAEYWRISGDAEVRQCVANGLAAVLKDRRRDGTFQGWGFKAASKAFTHTIAYTLQGLVESALALDLWEPFGTAAAESCWKLLRKYEVRGRLAGAYGPRWKASAWYQCLTGHCQLASTWMRIYDREKDPRLLNSAAKALMEVCGRQQIKSSNPNLRGAIAGSAPAYGNYMRLRYPNWAAKFFVDAMLELTAKLEHLSGLASPCLAGAA